MTELDDLDRTVQFTRAWLNEIGETIGPDKQRCYQALRAVLCALRDRMPQEEAFHFSAQLPTLVRGMFWDGYRTSGKPKRLRTQEEFLADVNSRFGAVGPVDPEDSARAVFAVLARHIPPGDIDEIRHLLPHDVHKMFDVAAAANAVL